MSATNLDLTALRDALLDLPSSGPNGFEGLLATVFAKLLGVPFRLAKSGSQFGVDGKTSDPAFPIAFEAKRYRGDVPSTEVLNKIGALAIRDDPVELWILGTTGIVSSQVADDLDKLATIHGFATLILDWQPDAPKLAAVLAKAHIEVSEFLKKNVPTAGLAARAIAELPYISGRTDLMDIGCSVLSQLSKASVATPMARSANRRWLVETLSNRIRAKSRLGQVLTPLEATGSPILTRGHLRDQLQTALIEKSSSSLISVLGEEGNGKSWIAIEACVELSTAPLVVVFSAEEFVTIPEGVIWDEIIARKLITQTEESVNKISEARWRRRFERWRNAEAHPSPRLLVLVDGLNQRPAITWGRHIDSLVQHVNELGGGTVVTSRSEYFSRYVEPRLISQITSIVIPHWTEQERDQILMSKGVASVKLQSSVANSLLNPRLLRIALTLLDVDTLSSLEALSVPWLLFEHLRMLDRDRCDSHSAVEFADMLQGHAKDILARVRLEVTDDLAVFENLEPAAEGRFFQWIEGEPHRYTLREQGFTYALGLAVIEELRAAVRNGKNIQEALETILEPIAALDQTADAAIAALTIASLDHRIPEEIGVALLVGFAQLQNPDDALAVSLIELARSRVDIFCEASEVLWMAPVLASNSDWLEGSLQAIKHRPGVYERMQPFLEKWLRYWCPDVRVDYKVQHTQGLPSDERVDAEAERDQRINNTSEVEREYLSQLIRQRVSPHRLMQLAMRICACMPLESLAHSLTCASFSMAITPTHFLPHNELSNLILFNRRDWTATRDRLLIHTKRLQSLDTSVSGRWAAVTLLRATGALADSAVAHKLVVELTKDREQLTSWRLVESYCATDPCNPDSARPDNIDETSRKYAQLDVSKFKLAMGIGEQDHFVESALPGLARFSPDIAVQKHREFLAAIPSRRGIPLRQAAWAAQNDAALIDDQLANRFLALSRSMSSNHAGVDKTSVEHVQQALLQAAFPRLSPQDQFAGVDAIPDPNHIWLDLLRLIKDGSSAQLLNALRLRSSSDLRVAVPLVIASSMADAHLPNFVSMLPELLASPHSLVRSAACNLAVITGDPEALKAVVVSEWTSSRVSQTTREHIMGSIALIEAARNGLASVDEILPRIAPETFGTACARLDDASVEKLASMLDACVRAASGFDIPPPPVEMVLAITRTTDAINAQMNLEEVSTASASFLDALKNFSDDQSEFDTRQKRLHDSYWAFAKQLTPEMAAVVLNACDLDGIHAIMRVAPSLVQSWIVQLSGAPTPTRWALRNFGLFVACALTKGEMPSKGVELLTLLQKNASFVHVQYTLAGLPLEAVSVWKSADSVETNQLRFARLDACNNDQALALEAATAIYVKKERILKDYVHERMRSSLPIDIARAITVAGFSNDTLLASDLVEKFDDDEGFLVTAARSSRYAMERHQWCKHWFNKMLFATTEENFWTASILFLKVVDGRFEAEHQDKPIGTDVFNAWWWSVERRLERRFDKWADKRKKTLFGSKVPDLIYLAQPQ